LNAAFGKSLNHRSDHVFGAVNVVDPEDQEN